MVGEVKAGRPAHERSFTALGLHAVKRGKFTDAMRVLLTNSVLLHDVKQLISLSTGPFAKMFEHY